jgi:hypothetical protein
MSTAYLVFNPKTTDLNYFNEGAFQPHLSAVPNAVRAWEGADIYMIPTEAKVQEYSDDSIIFFPKAMVIPQLSPLWHPGPLICMHIARILLTQIEWYILTTGLIMQ